MIYKTIAFLMLSVAANSAFSLSVWPNDSSIEEYDKDNRKGKKIRYNDQLALDVSREKHEKHDKDQDKKHKYYSSTVTLDVADKNHNQDKDRNHEEYNHKDDYLRKVRDHDEERRRNNRNKRYPDNNFSMDINGEAHFGGHLSNVEGNKAGVKNSAEFGLTAKNKFSDELSYGANATISLDPNSITPKQMYIFLDNDNGRFELGNYKNAAETLKLDASSIATIEGGFDNSAIASIGNIDRGDFYTSPLLYSAYARKKVGDIYPNTITYYSPSYSESPIRFGISYTRSGPGYNIKDEREKLADTIKRDPATGLSEAATEVMAYIKGLATNVENPKQIAVRQYKNIVSAGAVYENDDDNLRFKVAATGEMGYADGENPDYSDLFGMNIGVGLQYAGLKLVGSYANLGRSGLDKSETTKDTAYTTIGGSYEVGPAMASIGYFSSKTTPDVDHENTLGILSLGTHYHLTGKIFKFTPYISLNYFSSEKKNTRSSTTVDNNGYMFLTGLKVLY